MNSNINILIVTHNNNEKSGGNRSLLSIVDEWRSSTNIYALCNHSRGNLPVELSSRGAKCIYANYDWCYVPRRSNPIRQAAVIVRCASRRSLQERAVKHLVGLIDSLKIEAVYSNTGVIDIGYQIARKLEVPHIWHIREFGKEDFNLIPLITSSKRQRELTDSKEVIFVSKALKNAYDRKYGLKNSRVIYNGININNRFGNYCSQAPDGHFNVLIAGQLSPGKGQDQAIECVDYINRKYLTNQEVHLYIAGSGDKTYLKSSLDSVVYKDRIHFLGQVDEMDALRDTIQVAMVCSSAEAFGRVTIESFAHGIPVIGANCGGTAELVQNGVNGFLYEYGDIQDAADKLLKIIESSDLRNKLSDNAVRSAHKYSIGTTAKEVYELVAKCIANKESN